MKGDYPVCPICLAFTRRARPLQMSSSRSTLSATTSDTPTQGPVNTQSADGGSSSSSSSSSVATGGASNYFFGFLFLFAIILLILVGCGIGTRRRLLARRAVPLTSLEPWSSSTLKGEVTPPKFHETRIWVGHATGWKDIMPLSIAYLTGNKQNLDEKSDDPSVRPTTPESIHQFPRTFLPSLRKSPSNSKVNISPSTTNEIRMAILIAMPSPRDSPIPLEDRHIIMATPFIGEKHFVKNPPAEIQIGVETIIAQLR